MYVELRIHKPDKNPNIIIIQELLKCCNFIGV